MKQWHQMQICRQKYYFLINLGGLYMCSFYGFKRNICTLQCDTFLYFIFFSIVFIPPYVVSREIFSCVCLICQTRKKYKTYLMKPSNTQLIISLLAEFFYDSKYNFVFSVKVNNFKFGAANYF